MRDAIAVVYVLSVGVLFNAYLREDVARAVDDAARAFFRFLTDLPRRSVRWLRDRSLLDDHRNWIVEPPELFAAWWRETEVSRRRRFYVARHARDRLYDSGEWRAVWAAHPTQAWPTLATTGNAWDVVPQLRPMICTSELWTIHVKPTICVRDLRIHSLAHIG